MKKNNISNNLNAAKANIATLTWLLALCGMVGPFTTDMYLPSFHNIAVDFNVSLESVQQTLSFYLLGFAVMTLFYGTISDLIGRRAAMLGGFALFTLASFAAALSPSLQALIAFRFIEGLFAGCGMVVGMAVVRDLYGGIEAQKVMANIAMVFSFGPALAPVIGGFWATHLQWHANFYFLTALGLLLCILNYAFLPESLPKEKRTPIQAKVIAVDYGQALRSAPFMLGSCALAISFLGQGAFIAGAADWCVNVRGYAPDEFWKLFLPMIVGIVGGSWLSSRLAMRYGTPNTLKVGFLMMALASIWAPACLWLFAQQQQHWLLAISPLTIYTFGASILRPGMTLLIMDLFPRSRGLASSLLNFVQMLFFALCSALLVPALYGNAWAYAWNFGVMTMISITLWYLSAWLQTKSHRHNVPFLRL